jgi:hypothetical protein
VPTLEGIVFVPLAIYYFLKRPDLLFPLLIVAAVFQASSIVSSGPIGLQPYYIVALLFILRFWLQSWTSPIALAAVRTPIRVLALFGLVGVASAVILPIVFAGTLVYDPKNGIDAGYLQQVPLHLQMGNFAQAIFLIINILVVVAAGKQVSNVQKTHRALAYALYITVFFVFLQFACFELGINFPASLLNNNPGYGVVNLTETQIRPNGSFTEPSMAGAALACFAGAYLATYMAGKSSITKGALAVLACLLVGSSSSLLAVVLLVITLFAAYPMIRWPGYINLHRIRRLALFFGAGIVCAAILFVPSIQQMLISQTVGKGETWSALVRLGADAYAAGLALKTYGLGVGLGGNRPSSLALSLLSQVGVLGLALFVYAVASAFVGLPKEHRWIGWAGFGLFLAMALGVPDLSFPFVWAMLGLAVQSKAASAVSPDALHSA